MATINQNVAINIKGKNEASQPIDKATASLNKMQKSITTNLKPLTNFSKSLGSMTKLVAPAVAGFAAITGAVAKMNKVMKECEAVWKSNELAYSRMDWASKLNANLKSSSAAMKNWASDITESIGGWVDDGDLLTALGDHIYSMTSEQIKKIGDSALDLMAATGMDLNTAVDSLAQSYTGTLSKSLKVIAPEMANLTKEELEQGKALDVIKIKVNGAAKAMSETTNGSLESYKVAISALKSELGAVFTENLKPMRAFFTEWASQLANALKNIRTVNTAQSRLKNGTATSDDIQALIDKKEAEKAVVSGAKEGFWADVWRSLRTTAAASSGGQMAITKAGATAQIDNEIAELQKLKLAAEKKEAEALKKQEDALKGLFVSTVETTDANTEYTDATLPLIDEVIDLKNKFNIFGVDLEQMYAEMVKNIRTGILSGAGSTGDLANTLMDYLEDTNNLADLITNLVTPLLSHLQSMSEGFNNFSNLVDSLYQMLADDLVMLFDLLQPIFDFISAIVSALNPILKILLSLVAVILEPMMKILTWIAQGIQSLFEKYLVPFFNKIISGINFVIRALNNLIHLVNKKAAGISEIGEISTQTIFSSASATGTTSGSATYSGAKDVYVNIYYNHSFVNGDAREIALTIRDELTMAEKLGY